MTQQDARDSPARTFLRPGDQFPPTVAIPTHPPIRSRHFQRAALAPPRLGGAGRSRKSRRRARARWDGERYERKSWSLLRPSAEGIQTRDGFARQALRSGAVSPVCRFLPFLGPPASGAAEPLAFRLHQPGRRPKPAAMHETRTSGSPSAMVRPAHIATTFRQGPEATNDGSRTGRHHLHATASSRPTGLRPSFRPRPPLTAPSHHALIRLGSGNDEDGRAWVDRSASRHDSRVKPRQWQQNFSDRVEPRQRPWSA